MNKKSSASDFIFNALNAMVMLIVCIATFYPFIYMIMLSLSGGDTYGRIMLWPHGFTTLAYDLMLNKVRFLDSLAISVIR